MEEGGGYKGTSATFLFGLGPGVPKRLGPNPNCTRFCNDYQVGGPSWWPTWGHNGHGLSMGREGPPGLYGVCDGAGESFSYDDKRNEICGGHDNWVGAQVDVWRLANQSRSYVIEAQKYANES